MNASSLAISVMGLLLALNVVLTLTAIRRLRELDEAPHQVHPAGLPGAGTALSDFAVTDLAGASLTLQDLGGASRLVFLLPGCGPCEAIRKGLHQLADNEVRLVVAVFADPATPEAQTIIDDLPAHARVVAGIESTSRLATAAGVTSYPAVITVVDGLIVAASMQLVAAPAAPVRAGAGA